MVYAIKFTIRVEHEDNTEDKNNLSGSGDCCSEEKNEQYHATKKPRSNMSTSNKIWENSGAKHSKEGEKKTVLSNQHSTWTQKRTKVKILKYHLKMICRLRHRNRRILMIETKKLQYEICNDLYILSYLS